MFSVGINLYLVPTINGDVKYQPKHISLYGMILKLEAGKGMYATLALVLCMARISY